MRICGNLPDNSASVFVRAREGTISDVAVGGFRPSWPYISPGFVDLQLNGFSGVDFSSPDLKPDQLAPMSQKIWQTGVTTFCPTLITNSQDALTRNLRILETARKSSPEFARTAPCYHLEGPYFAPGAASGVHTRKWMRPPSWGEFQELQEAAGGHIALVTLGPEVPGAIQFIRQLVKSGVVVGISHTEAAAEDIHRAADAGARLSTHLGNGCPQLLDRHVAPFWAQLANDRLAASLVCDSFHLTSEMVKIIHKVKGTAGCILVSDATYIAGLPPGRYRLLDAEVELLPNGKVVRADGGSLAGASVSLDRGTRLFMQQTGSSLPQALGTVTTNPAQLLGSFIQPSELRPFSPANLVAFRVEKGFLRVESVMLTGEIVYGEETAEKHWNSESDVTVSGGA